MRRHRRTRYHRPYSYFGPSLGGLAAVVGAYLVITNAWFPVEYINALRGADEKQNDVVGFHNHSEAIAGFPVTLSVVSVVSVYDGDTFYVETSELISDNGQGIPIRIRGVDAPEIDGQCEQERELAIVSRDWLAQVLEKAETIQLVRVDYGEDPYGRPVADVIVDGRDLGNQQLATETAVVWSTYSSSPWCR